jgi:hypothetical protein
METLIEIGEREREREIIMGLMKEKRAEEE